MNHLNLTFAAALAFAAATSAPVRAQDSQPAQPATPASTPTTAQDATPSNAAANNATANSATPGSAAASSASPADPAKTPAKRVWTNDDVDTLRSSSAISTVGGNSNSGKAGAKAATTAPRSKNAQYYYNQITKLQGQIPPIDEKISALQAAIEGKPVTEARQYGWSKPGDWPDALAQLQKQKADIQTKIQSLEDQARHVGVPDNQIP